MSNSPHWTWPFSRLGDAVAELARAGGARTVHTLPVPHALQQNAVTAPDPLLLERWFEGSADCLGLNLTTHDVSYGEFLKSARTLAPAVLQVASPADESTLLVVLLRERRHRVLLVTAAGTRVWVARRRVVEALRGPIAADLRTRAAQALKESGLAKRWQQRAATSMAESQLSSVPVARAWQLSLPLGRAFWQHALARHLPQKLSAYLLLHFAQYGLLILSWWLIGKAALQGRVERGWLLAWLLLALTQVPLGMLAAWARGTFAIGLGSLLKSRLLEGAFAVAPDETREQGAGQLLGRVIESAAVERLALTGGLSAVVASIELLVAATILVIGPSGGLRLAVLAAWSAITAWHGWYYYRIRLRWAATRREMTNDLVERMLGHRTRLAQMRPDQWHEGEDDLLARYIDESRTLDRHAVRLRAVLSRGWLAAGLGSLLPIVVIAPQQPMVVAVALGGVLLAARALGTLVTGMDALGAAAVAWQQVGALFRQSGARPAPNSTESLLWLGQKQPAAAQGGSTCRPTLLEARDLVFRYRPEREPILRSCSLTLRDGERLLLEGPSGGGKSTLALVLAGVRRAEHGLVLLDGLDIGTLGQRIWSRRIVAAPQFHENHVFSGTLAFNLLMGRRWPPRNEDLAAAARLCRELGLGDLLDRMPAGLQQVVGETGWRLSHGEQSRLFIARALLQEPDLMLLDESFAALDPESTGRALRCVLQRARTLVVVAHA